GTAVIMKGVDKPGKGNLGLHTDSHGVPPPTPTYSQTCNTSWILTDYTSPDDGPTVLVPGSHNWGRIPTGLEVAHWLPNAPVRSVPLIAPAGSLAVWHGNLWHGSIDRTNPGLRITLIYYWMRSYMRPITLWQDEVPEDLLDRHPELERVLGFDNPYPYPGHSSGQ